MLPETGMDRSADLVETLSAPRPGLPPGAARRWPPAETVLARRAATGETLAVTLLPVLRIAMAAAVAWSAVYRFFTLFATQPWLQGLNPSLYFDVARLVQFWM